MKKAIKILAVALMLVMISCSSGNSYLSDVDKFCTMVENEKYDKAAEFAKKMTDKYGYKSYDELGISEADYMKALERYQEAYSKVMNKALKHADDYMNMFEE